MAVSGSEVMAEVFSKGSSGAKKIKSYVDFGEFVVCLYPHIVIFFVRTKGNDIQRTN